MIQIIDNPLTQEEFKRLKQDILDVPSDDWVEVGIVNEDDKEKQSVLSLYDGFIPQHPLFSKLYYDRHSILSHLQPKALIRIKINKMFRTEEPFLPAYHSDVANCMTAIFHLSTTNGKTVFKNGIEIDGIENRLIIFDSNLLHTGYTCTDKEERIVLNVNYFRRLPWEEVHADK